MEVLKALLLGIIQGFTEFLPVSSSGHISVVNYFLGETGSDNCFLTALLHIGTLIAVVISYRKLFKNLIIEAVLTVRDVFNRKFSFRGMTPIRRMLFFLILSCVPMFFLLLPAGDGDLVFRKVAVFSMDDSILCEGICFFITGIVIVAADLISQRYEKTRDMNALTAFIAGAAVTVSSAFPGLSGTGLTLSSGIVSGAEKNNMLRYSFIIALPLVIASNISELHSAVELGSSVTFPAAIVGIIAAAVSGIFAIRLCVKLIRNNRLAYFGFYCFAAGAVCVIATIFK